ncbi:50S ribosomal protein L17 [Thermodesulfobacterium thermophilum]|uniref:50S ribosomal protein L17 n=1 Tax=Thermodesulfobacterium thermophilum TaxID=886 RepID=UPI0003B454B2|nr:50S ribosomal protein L17 [Thermodesulfobacterium thermophilum]
MRHRKVSRRLGRDTEHHWAIMRNQVRDLLKHGKVVTTIAKAKELRRVAERMITLAKKGDLVARRRALSFINDKEVVRKLFKDLREKFLDRSGGYTRIIKIGPRQGDASMMVLVELVEEKVSAKSGKKKGERLKKVLEFIEKKKKQYGVKPQEEKSTVEKTAQEDSSVEGAQEIQV